MAKINAIVRNEIVRGLFDIGQFSLQLTATIQPPNVTAQLQLNSTSIRFRIAGPRTTRIITGNRNMVRGKRSFRAAFCEACSARWRRLVRSESAKMRTALAIDDP